MIVIKLCLFAIVLAASLNEIQAAPKFGEWKDPSDYHSLFNAALYSRRESRKNKRGLRNRGTFERTCQSNSFPQDNECACLSTCEAFGDPHIRRFGRNKDFKVKPPPRRILKNDDNNADDNFWELLLLDLEGFIVKADVVNDFMKKIYFGGEIVADVEMCDGQEGKMFEEQTAFVENFFLGLRVYCSLSKRKGIPHLDLHLHKIELSSNTGPRTSDEILSDSSGICLDNQSSQRQNCECRSTCAAFQSPELVPFGSDGSITFDAKTAVGDHEVTMFSNDDFEVGAIVGEKDRIEVVRFGEKLFDASEICEEEGKTLHIGDEEIGRDGGYISVSVSCEKRRRDWFFNVCVDRIVPDDQELGSLFRIEEDLHSKGLCFGKTQLPDDEHLCRTIESRGNCRRADECVWERGECLPADHQDQQTSDNGTQCADIGQRRKCRRTNGCAWDHGECLPDLPVSPENDGCCPCRL